MRSNPRRLGVFSASFVCGLLLRRIQQHRLALGVVRTVALSTLLRQIEDGHVSKAVISPNGLITDFFGPISGRRGDGYMLRRSQLEARLAHLCQLAGAPFYVYGDPAYPLTKYILRGFKGPMTALQVVGWRVWGVGAPPR